MEKALANVTWELCLLSAGLRACIPALPWGPRWEAGPRAFPESCLSNSPCPTQSGISCPLFGLYYPISLLHWVISFLYRGMFLGPWDHFLPAYCLPPPFISSWVPGRALGVPRVHLISQQELAGTQPLRAPGIRWANSDCLPISRKHHL